MTTSAIIPLKALADAKGRLAAALAPQQRRELVTWMAQRVILACRGCSHIDDVLVVAGDVQGAHIAQRAGAEAVVVEQQGLALALDAADARTAHCSATVVVAADLPALTARDLDALFEAQAGPGPIVVLAPTEDGGTGALLRRPPSAIATAYGPGSAAAHLRLAAAAGVRCAVVRREGLSFDLDQPEQLPAALAIATERDVPCRPR